MVSSGVYAGIDAGSRAIKIVLLDGRTLDVRACACTDQGPRPGPATQEAYDSLLSQNRLTCGDVRFTVATGYARGVVLADATVTEITCHAVGVHHLLPQVRTVVEIGGQDSKLLWLTDGGRVRDFAMNDRCAAGTGRFLELVAARLGRPLSDLGPLANASTRRATISSMCAVFAETEIIGLLASECPPESIVASVQSAIASRVAAMAGGNVAPPLAFTGGVAMVAGMDKALEESLGCPVVIPDSPQYTGALGAALLAARDNGT